MVRTRGRQVADRLSHDAESAATRNSRPVVVALDRAQQAVVDLGEGAYERGQRVVRQAAQEIRARPWTTACLLGGAMLAGASFYMMQRTRRR